MKLVYLTTARIPDEWAHVIQILKMCEAFADQGHEVTVLAPRRAATRSDDPFAYAGVRTNFSLRILPCIDLFPGAQSGVLYWLRTLSFLVMARFYLGKNSYDLLYTREPFSPGTAAKTVYELHSLTRGIASAVPRLNRARRIVAITEGLKRDLVAAGVSESRIVVAPDGVDLDDFAHPEPKAQARARLGIAQNAKAAFYIGILDAWKGTETLYAAAQLLAPEVQTVIIGGFPAEREELVKAHPQVRFLGFKPYRELPDNQQAADVLVLPNSGREAISAKYTSPLKLFTYMASGIPIVASDLPSLREVLSEKNAYLVRPDDPEALAAGIREALAHPEEALARATQARSDVARYSWKARAEAILKSI